MLDTVHESQDESEAFDSPAEESDLDSNETNAEQVGYPAGERHSGPCGWGFFAHFYGAKTRRQLRPINPQGRFFDFLLATSVASSSSTAVTPPQSLSLVGVWMVTFFEVVCWILQN